MLPGPFLDKETDPTTWTVESEADIATTRCDHAKETAEVQGKAYPGGQALKKQSDLHQTPTVWRPGKRVKAYIYGTTVPFDI